jgi:hypothetical protein
MSTVAEFARIQPLELNSGEFSYTSEGITCA